MPSTSRSRSGCVSMDRADATDHAGREVPLDAIDGGRRGGAQKVRLELLTMGAIIHPFA
jgi:hypothetical protein